MTRRQKAHRSSLAWLVGACLIPMPASSVAGCDEAEGDGAQHEGWYGELPPGFPTPTVPADNPMTAEKIALGRHLFFDEQLSGNGTQSCSSCHEPRLAFADGIAVPQGSTGQTLARNSMALVNTAYNSAYTWANPALDTLERQIAVPLFGEFPVELGVTGNEERILDRLRADELYPELFAAAFPDAVDPITLDAAIDGLASFVRSMVSGNSPYDRFTYQGDEDALSESELRGMDLFFSELIECHHCHGGFNFSFSTTHANSSLVELTFHNTGLYNVDGEGAYPTNNAGLYDITGDPNDMGRFRAPTLRNIEVTAPYMHDGSILTLEEVVRFYETGGRVIEEGQYAGDGRSNPYKSAFVSGFVITDQERDDLVAFLRALTDTTFLENPAYTNPRANSGE